MANATDQVDWSTRGLNNEDLKAKERRQVGGGGPEYDGGCSASLYPIKPSSAGLGIVPAEPQPWKAEEV